MLAASDVFDQERAETNAKTVTSNPSREKSLADFISSTPYDDSFAALTIYSTKGGTEVARRPCYRIPNRDLGQWLCVPSFRMVCLFLVF
jgi:hypothetical protein